MLGSKMRPRVYLSASIGNAPINARLRDALAGSVELVLPQEFTPDVEHAHLPRAIYEACIEEMERCDAALVLLDALGVDCAMECGWLRARGKPLVALAGSSLQFSRHWMVKGTLDLVAAFDPLVVEALRADPILAGVPIRACARLEDVGAVLSDVLSSNRTEGRR
jgi:hypothetical protein